MKKRITFSIIIFLVFFALGTALKVRAGVSQSARGWLWGGSEDLELGPTGTIDGNETGMGWLNMNCATKVGIPEENLKVCNGGTNDHKNCNGPGAVLSCPGGSCVEACSVVEYGVNIPDSTGALSGYAWSENLGWIDFGNNCIEDNSADDSDPIAEQCTPIDATKYCSASCIPPPATGCTYNYVNREGEYLKGCARIVDIAKETVSGNSGGWQGFIRLNNTAIDPSTGKLLNFGWNGENKNDPVVSTNMANGFGWLDLKWAKIEKPKKLKICVNSCNSGWPSLNDQIKTINVEDSIKLHACYDDSDGCADTDSSGDVTGFSPIPIDDTGSPDEAVDGIISGSDFLVTGVNIGKKEDVEVNYDGKNAKVTISVECVFKPAWCSDSAQSAERRNTCRGRSFKDNCGGYACECTQGDCRDCTVWREIGQ